MTHDRSQAASTARDFLELAGSVAVPAEKRNVAWDEVLRQTWRLRAASRR